MSTEGDEVTRYLIEGMGLLSSGVPGGYQERGHGVVLNVIGLDSPSTNTLHVLEPSASRRDAERMVRRVQEAGLPFVFRVRPNAGMGGRPGCRVRTDAASGVSDHAGDPRHTAPTR